jgi:hypothetical protein
MKFPAENQSSATYWDQGCSEIPDVANIDLPGLMKKPFP